jgi:hypothetical protein
MKKVIYILGIVLMLPLFSFADDITVDVFETSPGLTDGAIDLTVTGGVAPFEFLWTGPDGFTATEEDINDLAPGTYTVTVSDAACGITSFDVEVEEGEIDDVGIEDPAQPFAVNLFPNPTDGRVFLVSEYSLDIVVYNILGKCVANANGVNEFDLSNQPTGVYLVQISSEKGVLTKKITLQ